MSVRIALTALLMLAGSTPTIASAVTRTPIHHLVVVIGENVSFDALYATLSLIHISEPTRPY